MPDFPAWIKPPIAAAGQTAAHFQQSIVKIRKAEMRAQARFCPCLLFSQKIAGL